VAAIEAKGLVKVYRSRKSEVRALDGVDLDVREGTVLGLLGPNGAGKTTTVRILATLLRPDAGSARVAGVDVLRDPQAVRRQIGVSGQYAAVDENLTGRENLWMFGRLYGLPSADARRRADELLERFALADAADRVAKTYSGGMRRRLDLAGALIGSPRVLFLDEPTTGLDPRSRLGNVGRDPDAGARGRHAAPDDAVPRGSRRARRRDRRRRPRPHHRARHRRPAQVAGGRRAHRGGGARARKSRPRG
jgi:ABC-2 type transport system ATP-binding protein